MHFGSNLSVSCHLHDNQCVFVFHFDFPFLLLTLYSVPFLSPQQHAVYGKLAHVTKEW